MDKQSENIIYFLFICWRITVDWQAKKLDLLPILLLTLSIYEVGKPSGMNISTLLEHESELT